MAGRFTFGVLLVSCLLRPQPAAAQGGPSPFGNGSLPVWAPPAGGGPVSPASFSGYDAGHVAPSPYYAGPPPGPDAYCPPGAGVEGQGWWGPSLISGWFLETVKRSWVRAEWLDWTIEEPGRQLMGAPLATVEDPRQVFRVFDFQVPPQPLAGAFVPDLTPITFKDTNGVRGTLGIPLEFGQFEASVFALERAEDSFFRGRSGPVNTSVLGFPDDPLPPIVQRVPIVPALTLLENGRLSNIVLLYNRGLTISYESEIWGTEAVFVGERFPFELAAPERGLTMRPIIGFRYLDVDEQLSHVGRFRDPLLVSPLLVSTIQSETDNDIYGGILGFRTEFQHRWFTLGAEPRVTLGVNDYSASVTTHQLRGFFDPRFTTVQEDTIFSPVLDFKAYARIHLHENFSLHVGYDVLWFSRVTRPHENIVFNDPGSTLQPPGVVVDADIEELMLEGLSLGGEIRFR